MAKTEILTMTLAKAPTTFPCTYSKEGIEAMQVKKPDRLGNAYRGRKYTLVKWLHNVGYTSYARRFIEPIGPIPRNKSMVIQ